MQLISTRQEGIFWESRKKKHGLMAIMVLIIWWPQLLGTHHFQTRPNSTLYSCLYIPTWYEMRWYDIFCHPSLNALEALACHTPRKNAMLREDFGKRLENILAVPAHLIHYQGWKPGEAQLPRSVAPIEKIGVWFLWFHHEKFGFFTSVCFWLF